MRFRFIHTADIHLGYEQYNSAKRADDFAHAFMRMVETAIAEQVDFVLLAGDLFHRASADAWMLRQATAGLDRLKAERIPVVAVEGNHDAQHARKHLSWMEFLADQDLLILLDLQKAENNFRGVVPWDPESGRGTWVDIAGARIYGLKYYGAALGRILEDVEGDIEPGPAGYTILMLHAGIEGQVPHLHGGLTPGQLAPLHGSVDYLALGHVHKRLELDGWIYNPGSLETCSTEEMEWAHGFFLVEVDTEAEPRHTVSAIDPPGTRPFRRIIVPAEGVLTIDDYVALAEERIAAARAIPEEAVVELLLSGAAEFKRQDVPLEQLKGLVEMHYRPLLVRVKNNLVAPGTVSIYHGERMRREELERQVVEQLVYQEGEYRDHAAAWTRLVLEVKNMAAEKDAPAAIADLIANHLGRLDGDSPEAVETVAEPEPDLGPPPDGDALASPEPGSSLTPPPPLIDLPELPTWEPEGGEAPCMAHLFEDW